MGESGKKNMVKGHKGYDPEKTGVEENSKRGGIWREELKGWGAYSCFFKFRLV